MQIRTPGEQLPHALVSLRTGPGVGTRHPGAGACWIDRASEVRAERVSDIAGSIVGAQRLLPGELDFVGEMSPQEVLQLQGRQGLRLPSDYSPPLVFAAVAHVRAVFDNAKLRQAIAHGINRKRINDIVMARLWKKGRRHRFMS